MVAGDRGTVKSSLIVTAISNTFPSNVPHVLPPIRMPDDFYSNRVLITITDTSSNAEDASKVVEELKRLARPEHSKLHPTLKRVLGSMRVPIIFKDPPTYWWYRSLPSSCVEGPFWIPYKEASTSQLLLLLNKLTLAGCI